MPRRKVDRQLTGRVCHRVKFFGVRLWGAVVIALFGFWLSHIILAPAVESGTRSGVDVVNGTDE